MRITNTTPGPLGLTPDHMIPAHGAADVPDAVLASARGSAAVAWWIETGALVIGAPGQDQPQPRRRGRPRKAG